MSEWNPDWAGYQNIFENQGAWLGDQARDVGFVKLNAYAIALLGEYGYEQYRLMLGTYFLLVIALLSSGRIFCFNIPDPSYFFLVLALLNLGIIRFTIQVREGVAITLVLFALGLVCSPRMGSRRYSGDLSRFTQPTEAIRLMVSVLLLSLATAFHLAAFSFFIMIFCAHIMAYKASSHGTDLLVRNTFKFEFKLVWLLSVVFASILLVSLYVGGAVEQMAADAVGDRFDSDQGRMSSKLLRLGCYGVACVVIFLSGRAIASSRSIAWRYAVFLRILTGPATLVIYASSLFGTMLALPDVYLVGYTRLLSMFLAVALTCFAFSGRRNWRVSLVAIFLLADGIRSALVSVLAVP